MTQKSDQNGPKSTPYAHVSSASNGTAGIVPAAKIVQLHRITQQLPNDRIPDHCYCMIADHRCNPLHQEYRTAMLHDHDLNYRCHTAATSAMMTATGSDMMISTTAAV